MRTVAVACALLSVLAAIPLSGAEDECRNNAAAAQACVPVELRPSQPGVPTTPYWGKYYLWISPLRCVPGALSTDCRGVPAAPNPGIPTPDGSGAIGVGTFGVLWVESNGLAGLQRSIDAGGGRIPDRMVLV